MKTDLQVQKDVLSELRSEPALNAAALGVTVHNGIVTLSGEVAVYTQKLDAVKATARAKGVRAVANDIRVFPSDSCIRTDTELAHDIFKALEWTVAVQEDQIDITVENGVVVLEGEVDHDAQRQIAVKTIETMQGVRSVINKIKLRKTASAGDIEDRIRAAFRRSAVLDVSGIHVTVKNNKAILSGTVSSLSEKEDAERTARAAPGITDIENRIAVGLPYTENIENDKEDDL